jgi:hypothetical protein
MSSAKITKALTPVLIIVAGLALWEWVGKDLIAKFPKIVK